MRFFILCLAGTPQSGWFAAYLGLTFIRIHFVILVCIQAFSERERIPDSMDQSELHHSFFCCSTIDQLRDLLEGCVFSVETREASELILKILIEKRWLLQVGRRTKDECLDCYY